MALARRAQSEAASAADAEIILLTRCLDYYPISVNQRLGVHHPWLRATERPIIPDHRFCTRDHELVAINVGQPGSLLQNWIEDSLRQLSFHGWSFSCC